MAMTNLRSKLQRQRLLEETVISSAGSVGSSSSMSHLSQSVAHITSSNSAVNGTNSGLSRSLVITRPSHQNVMHSLGSDGTQLVTVTTGSSNSTFTLFSQSNSSQSSSSRGLENPTRFHLEQQAKKSSTPLVQQLLAHTSSNNFSVHRPPDLQGLQRAVPSSNSFDDPLSPQSQTGSDLDTDPIFGPEITLEHVQEIDWSLIEPTLNQLSHTVPTNGDGVLYHMPNDLFDINAVNHSEMDPLAAALLGEAPHFVNDGSLLINHHASKTSSSAPAKYSAATLRAASLRAAATSSMGGDAGHILNCGAAEGQDNSVGSGVPSALSEEDLLAWQRERFKKDSHNRIERKRRENINHQISELGDILPNACFRDSEMKKNKGNILKATVEFIRDLSMREEERVKLEYENHALREKLIEYETLLRGLGLPLEGALQNVSSPSATTFNNKRLHQMRKSHSFKNGAEIKSEPVLSPQQDVELMDAVSAVAAAAANGSFYSTARSSRQVDSRDDWTKLSTLNGILTKDESEETEEAMDFNS